MGWRLWRFSKLPLRLYPTGGVYLANRDQQLIVSVISIPFGLMLLAKTSYTVRKPPFRISRPYKHSGHGVFTYPLSSIHARATAFCFKLRGSIGTYIHIPYSNSPIAIVDVGNGDGGIGSPLLLNTCLYSSDLACDSYISIAIANQSRGCYGPAYLH